MNQLDLSKLSSEELKNLIAEAERSLRERNQRRVMELRREAEELAASLNISVAELLGLDKSKRSSTKLAPKYMNPSDPSQTWTGRGKKPRWLADALERGEPIEKFMIG